MGLNIITYALSKKYTNKVGSTINGTSYDYDNAKLTFHTTNGDWAVPVNNGMNTAYKQTLDNIKYNTAEGSLEVNDVAVLTKDDVETEDIDFSEMF